MHYHRNPPKKSFFAYIIPFLILIILGSIVFLLIRFWGNLDERLTSETSYAQMQTLEGEAKVMLWGSTEWKSVPQGTIRLFKGDSIRALPGSKVKISLFERHYVTLNGDSELVISELRKEKQTQHTALNLNKGEAWLNIAREINPNSTFLIKTETFQVETQGAVLDVEPNIVRVVKGNVGATIFNNGEKVQEKKIGVGQELVLTDAKIKSLVEGDEEAEFLTMLSDEFKLSGWYLFNTEGRRIGDTNTGGTVADDPEEEDESAEEAESADDSTEDVETVEPEEEEEVAFELEKPIITSPASDGEEFTISGTSQKIEGKVKRGTSKIFVDNYELQSFKIGDTAWKYNADIRYNNLAKGKNVYKVYAEDAKGNRSEAAVITLTYEGEPEETTEEEEVETDEETSEATGTETAETTSEDEEGTEQEAEATPENTEVTGELKITEPNGGEDLTTKETHFVISGTAPSNAAKIVVSGYTLTTFKLGDTSWKYTADPKYDNIETGEANTYKVVAYDANDKAIDTKSLVITVEESEE